MRRLYSFLLVVVMCITSIFSNTVSLPVYAASEEEAFNNLSDPELLTYVEDQVYANLESTLACDDFIIEDIQTVYISKEYLEEVAYNSLENIYFGYSLKEVCEQFEGSKFVFTLGENGSTEVREFEEYDDSFERAIKNVAIGTGVIVICVTVSVVTAVAGAPAVVSAVFATSAKSAAIAAASSGALGGTMAGIVTGIQTKNFEEAIKAASVAGSEGFKWGAITGTATGGASAIFKVYGLPKIPINDAVKISNKADDVANVADKADDVANVADKADDVANVADKVDDVVNVADDADDVVNIADDVANSADDISNSVRRTDWQKSQIKAEKKYGGSAQKAYMGGKEVPYNTAGSTRPDILREVDNHLEAIEVKNYDLEDGISQMCSILKKQVAQRANDLPQGSTQRIALDVEGRGYSQEFLEDAIKYIQNALSDTYPNIPIDIL